MRILFDQGTPAPLRKWLVPHGVSTAFEEGWSGLANGDLLTAAEAAGFDLLATTDQNLRYQQNLQSRSLAILVLTTTSWPRIQACAQLVVDAVSGMAPAGFLVLAIP